MYVFRTVAEYILTFGRVPRQPRIISRSGYNSDWHSRHWTPTNKEGFCLLCPGLDAAGNIEHLLVTCQALNSKRAELFTFWDQQAEESPQITELLLMMRKSKTKEFVQFVLDPSVVPAVISGCQNKLYKLEEIFNLTRTYTYAMHRRRLQLSGKLNFSSRW